MGATSKTCTKCKETKALSEFYKHKGRKDGLRSDCKKCKREARSGYYANNLEKERERVRKYREDNPARSHMNRAVARIREYGLAPEPTVEAREKSLRHRESTINNPCFFCGSEVTNTWDHLTPISKGGNDAPSNLARVCYPCNSVKHARDADEFREYLHTETARTGTSSYEFVRSRCELESYADRRTRLINTSENNGYDLVV